MEEIKDVIIKLVKIYGIEYLYQEKFINELLNLNPDISDVYLNTIKYFLKFGINKQIYIIVNRHSEDENLELTKLRNIILQEHFLNSEQLEILDLIIQVNLNYFFLENKCNDWIIKFEKVVNELIEDNGVEILCNERTVNIIKSLHPYLQSTFLNTFQYYISTGIIREIYNIVFIEIEDKNNSLVKIKDKIIRNYILSDEQLILLNFMINFFLQKYFEEKDSLEWWENLDYEWKIILQENIKNYNLLDELTLSKKIYKIIDLEFKNITLPNAPLHDKLIKINRLSFINCLNVNLDLFRDLIDVKHLSIINDNDDEFFKLNDSIENFNFLESLTIKCPLTNVLGFNIRNLYYLKSLILEFSTDDYITKEVFFSNLIELKYLELKQVNLNSRSFDNFFNLEYLSYNINEFEDEMNVDDIRPSLKNLINLKSLTIFGDLLIEHGTPSFYDLPNPQLITDLILNKCSKIDLSILEKFINLQALTLDNCDLTQSRNIVFGKLINLKKLIIKKCTGFNPLPSINHLSTLDTLTIGNNKFIENEFNIDNLKKLDKLSLVILSQLSFDNIFNKLVNIKVLNIKVTDDINDNISFEKLNYLESLSLNNFKKFPKLSNLDKIKKLEIFNSNLLDIPHLDRFTNLETLIIIDCLALENLDLSKLSNLKKIVLFNTQNLISRTSLINLNKLREYTFYSKDLTTVFPVFKNITNLKVCGFKNEILKDLSIDENTIIINLSKFISVIPELYNFSNIQSLEIVNFHKLESLPSFNNLVNLKNLTIKNCSNLISIFELYNLKKLENLSIENCVNLKNIESLEDTINLKRLFINNCSNLITIPSLGNLINLKSLKFYNCSNITSIEFSEKLLGLKYICFNNCVNLISVHFLGNLENLEYVNFYKCLKLKNVESLDKIKALKSLCFNKCINIDSIHFLKSLKKLKYLLIDINDRSVLDLNNLSNIENLNIKNCNYVPSLNSLNNLKFLYLENCKNFEDIQCFYNLYKLKKLYLIKSIFINLPIFDNLNNLELLSITNCNFNNHIVYFDNLKKLKNLFILNDLYSINNSFNESILSIENLDQLVNLKLIHCNFKTNLLIKNSVFLKNVILEQNYFKTYVKAPNFLFSLIIIENRFTLDNFEELNNINQLNILGVLYPIIFSNIGSANTITITYDNDLSELNFSIDNLINLNSLSFRNLENLKSLPSLVKLDKIENLILDKLTKLEVINFSGNLEKLKKLYLIELFGLKSLPNFDNLINLEKLIFSGWRLDTFPSFDKLFNLKSLYFKNINMYGFSNQLFFPSLDSLNKLEILYFDEFYCYNSIFNDIDFFKGLISLKNLSFVKTSFVEIPHLDDLINLNYLAFESCLSLKNIPSLNNLKYLKTLIFNSLKIDEIPSLDNLIELESLVIINCYNLICLPSFEKLINLKSLIIIDCYNLKNIPKIDHFENLEFKNIQIELH